MLVASFVLILFGFGLYLGVGLLIGGLRVKGTAVLHGHDVNRSQWDGKRLQSKPTRLPHAPLPNIACVSPRSVTHRKYMPSAPCMSCTLPFPTRVVRQQPLECHGGPEKLLVNDNSSFFFFEISL